MKDRSGRRVTTRRALLIAVGTAAVLHPLRAIAQQQSAKVVRIGFLGTGVGAASEALLAGLRDHGYAEGKNLVIEIRSGEGKNERLPGLVAELVRLKVDVLVTSGTPATLAARNATTTTPIVMTSVGDPVRAGLVASLSRPGGNVTGLTQLGAELAGKRLQLLKDTLPNVSRVAFLWNPANAGQKSNYNEMQAAARGLNLVLQSVEVRAAHEFESAFARMMRERPDALIMTSDGLHRVRLAWIVDFAAAKRMPAMYQTNDYVEAGGLMSYGPSRTDEMRRAAVYVDKILKGAKPGDLPVEQPTKFELVVNLKTAKALGIKIPNSILLSADKVIE